eukprot:scaffold3924_cov37-Tisochrysis_lutea.AAC.1
MSPFRAAMSCPRALSPWRLADLCCRPLPLQDKKRKDVAAKELLAREEAEAEKAASMVAPAADPDVIY